MSNCNKIIPPHALLLAGAIGIDMQGVMKGIWV